MQRVYLSLGSNLGDREGYLRRALELLARLPGTRVVATSSMVETPPWGKTDQPAFLNMAAALDTSLTPEELLGETRNIENALGRQRTEHWGPRTIDIDLLVFEGEERDTPTLKLPHPYLTERRFVLEPLAEIAPGLVVRGKTVRDWLAAL
ncbi:MAG: 2-amino-4-hydroxy-6-hydroxymethyldihydropteridine diphosphokinase [Armatimonadota bacterium]